MYSIADYGAMIADKVRTQAYVRALRAVITPGSVVVDIGTGTGIFALLASRFGARRVYAIEPDDAIQVAQAMAMANGCKDRIQFAQALSTNVSLPERADVIVSDIGGMLPWFRGHIASISDARCRFLSPGGVLLPRQDTAWAAVVEAPEWYAEERGPWDDSSFDLDMKAAWRIVSNTFSRARVLREQLVTDVQRWATIDYAVVEDPNARGRLQWTVRRSGVGHGLAVGFDRVVAPGVHLSNAPDAPAEIRVERCYPNAMFPWPTPVPLAAGDHVIVLLEAVLAGEDYVWNWKTCVLDQGRAGAEKANFSQSTFFGVPLSPVRLHKRGASYTPTLTEDGRITRFVLESMNVPVSLGEIACRLSSEFADRFPRHKDALSYVADLAQRYG
jgi:type I protein arginine methyltransferase